MVMEQKIVTNNRAIKSKSNDYKRELLECKAINIALLLSEINKSDSSW